MKSQIAQTLRGPIEYTWEGQGPVLLGLSRHIGKLLFRQFTETVIGRWIQSVNHLSTWIWSYTIGCGT